MGDEGQQEDFSKLDVEDRLKHKNWKARVSAYEQLIKELPMADPDDAIFKKYAGGVKNFCQDSNAAALEKGIEAAIAFVDNANPQLAGRLCGDVVSGLVSKCYTARPKTKEKACELILLFIELEKQDATTEELLKGLDDKSPKVVSGCTATMRDALKLYGSKAITIKTALPKIIPLLENRDKTVREEARNFLAEVHRWVGDALKPKLNDLKPAQLAELEPEFAKNKGVKAVPEKLYRSEQAKKAAAVDGASAADADAAGGDEEPGASEEPLDLFEPVEILSRLNEEFDTKLQSKKWQDRKEALETLDKLSDTPKLAEGEYAQIVGDLKKVIAKDANVVVVALAGKCLAQLAKGLKADKKFQGFFQSCVSVILEKFKEKKANVVTAMRDAIDSCALPLSLELMWEDISAGIQHKTPSVKSETLLFLARRLTKCYPEDITKKQLKTIAEALITASNDPDPAVREAAFEALGTAKKVVGEKAITPFLVDLEQLKLDKIKEYCDKAVINLPKRKAPPAAAPKSEAPPKAAEKPAAGKKVVKGGAASKPKAAPSKDKFDEPSSVQSEPVETKPAESKSTTSVGSKATKKVPTAPAASKSKVKEEESTGPLIICDPKGKTQRTNDEKFLKVLKWSFQMPTKEFEQQLKDQMTPYFSSSLLTLLFSSDFKNQTKAVEALQADLALSKEATISVLDLILKWFTLRFFENNSTFLAKAFEYLSGLFKTLVEDKYGLTDLEISSFTPYLLLKIGDPKDVFRNHVKALIRQMCNIAPYPKVYGFLADGMKAKNSRQRTECIGMATWVMDSYGVDACSPNPQVALKNIAQQIGDRDQTVRNAALDNLALAYQLMAGDKEKLYKMISPMSDKDRSMLDERLKRTSVPLKSEPPKKIEAAPAKAAARKTIAKAATVPESQPELPEPDSVPNGKLERASVASSNSDISEKAGQGQGDADRPVSGLPRPGTVTLRRPPPALLPIAPEHLALAMDNVEVPMLKRGQNGSRARSGVETLSPLFDALAGSNSEAILQALEKLQEVVSNDKNEAGVRDNLLEILKKMSDTLRKFHKSLMPNFVTNYSFICNCYGCVLHILRVLFETPKYGDQATAFIISDLLSNLVSILLDRRMETMHGGVEIAKSVNVLILRIVDNANYTQILCATVRLYRELLGSGLLTEKFLDIVTKCVWRAIRKMPDMALQVDADPILMEIHLFLRQFPSSYWQTASDDTPFRSIKTIVHNLAKIYRSDLLNHMTQIDDPQTSELSSFLRRILRSVEDENRGRPASKNGLPATRSGNLTAHEETLTNIINKIGSADSQKAQKGLRELYDYKETNDINVDEFLERTSTEFQKFVTDNLRLIEFEQKALGLPNSALSEKGQGIIGRLRGVLSSPFISAQDLENIRLMADDVKIQIRNKCFETAPQRAEEAIRAADARVMTNGQKMESPRRPHVTTPSRTLRSLDDNSARSSNLEDVKARVKAYLANKGS